MRLSIIIPVYNHAQALEHCVESIIQQSILTDSPQSGASALISRREKSGDADTEIVIVNDGSTDDLDARMQTIKHQTSLAGIRLKYIDQENRGAAVARNVGFDHSTGEYVLFCDADIQWQAIAFEKFMGALQREPSAAFSYSQFRFGWKVFASSPFDLATLRQLNYIHTSALIRRLAFPRFDESLIKFQDWDLFLTIAERGGKGVFIPEVLFTIATGGTMSQWMPAFAYHAPFKYLPWWKRSVEKYELAKKVIIQKHNIQFPIPNSQ